MEKFTVKLTITDIPIEGATPLSNSYELRIFGIDPAVKESLERLKPPPVQEGKPPTVKVLEIS